MLCKFWRKRRIKEHVGVKNAEERNTISFIYVSDESI